MSNVSSVQQKHTLSKEAISFSIKAMTSNVRNVLGEETVTVDWSKLNQTFGVSKPRQKSTLFNAHQGTAATMRIASHIIVAMETDLVHFVVNVQKECQKVYFPHNAYQTKNVT